MTQPKRPTLSLPRQRAQSDDDQVRQPRRATRVNPVLKEAELRSRSKPQPAAAPRPAPAQPPRRTPTAPPRPSIESPDTPLRLSKRMAELGLCSRREADDYIARGWVTVDGVVVNELGSKVLPTQKVVLAREATTVQNRRVTVLIHKPIGYVSGQAEDGYQPASVLISVENHWGKDPVNRQLSASQLIGLAPAGRLDIDSTGLLVLTQDGRIAKKLIGEYSEVEKEYLVRVEGHLSDEGLRLLNHGLSLDGVQLRPAKVSWSNEDQLRFVLREGRKRQIRRMCELVGLRVTGLKRVRIGRIPLAALPLGQWRYLGEDESF
ncbi:MAG: pseudouridine synthase [Rhodocyclaceae bacterium]